MSSSGKSSSKGTNKIPEIDKLRLEAVIPANNYDFHLLIILFAINKITKKTSDLQKVIELIIKTRDLKKVKNMLFGIFKTLNDQQKTLIINFILDLKDLEISEKQSKISEFARIFNFKQMLDIHIYLFLNYSKQYFEYSSIENEYSDDTEVYYKTSHKLSKYGVLDDLLKIDKDELLEEFRNDIFYSIDIDERLNEFSETAYYKLFIFVELMRTKKIANINLLFNKLFMDVEAFFKKDPEMRIIKYYCLTKTNINLKLKEISKHLFPPRALASSADNSDAFYYSKIANGHINSTYGTITDENIIKVFNDIIETFFLGLLIYKKEISLPKKEEELIKEILEKIIKIIKDDNYHSGKYKSYFTFFHQNATSIDFFKYYMFYFILKVHLNETIIRNYMIPIFMIHIKELRNFSQTRRIDTSTITDPALRAEMEELIRTPDERRFSSRNVYTREFIQANIDNYEVIRKAFLKLMKEYYEKKSPEVINKFMYESVFIKISQKMNQ